MLVLILTLNALLPLKVTVSADNNTQIIDCESDGMIKHIDWNYMDFINDNNNNLSISFDPLIGVLTFEIDLEYLGFSYDSMVTNHLNLGTTYIIDFEAYNPFNNFTSQIGSCQNRLIDDFIDMNFTDIWTYSNTPYINGHLSDSSTCLFVIIFRF